MGLINIDGIIKKLNNEKCLISGVILLNPSEYVVSKSEFPELYEGKIAKGEKDNISILVKEMVAHKAILLELDSSTLDKISLFFTMILNANYKGGDELFLQAYIFIFWNKVDFHDSILPIKGDVFWVSNNFANLNEKFKYSEILKEIQSVALVDLIAIDSELGVLYLIEIKRSEVDDRCIGQIMRYYESSNEVLYKLSRKYNINYIRPMVVCQKIRVNFWKGLPLCYRDIFDFYTYKKVGDFSNNPRVTGFHNSRKSLLSSWCKS